MQNNANELKKRALLAKQRMKMGYWQELMRQREAMLIKVGDTANNAQLISEVQRAEIRRDANIIINNNPSLNLDEELYKKVKLILDNDEYVSNPIGQLIDPQKYDALDSQAKQRYILELGKKYKELKDRYYKEKIKTVN